MERAGPTTSQAPDAGAAFRANRTLQVAALLYAVLWIAAAIEPHDRFDWFLENILVFLTVPVLIASYRRFRLSTRSYVLGGLFLALHTVGSHYTYSLTPAGFWLQDALALERNHYDRVIHFAFGLLLFVPFREILVRQAKVAGRWASALSLAVILALGSIYEMLEWGAAEIVSPEAALAFLGTQGDVFDAQKDTALAAAGGLLALVVTTLRSRLSQRGAGA